MAYVKQTELEKNIRKKITELKDIAKKPSWASFMRAICYPHKGMMHTHVYFICEWYWSPNETTSHFFEWVEEYRQYCDSLPLSYKGNRSRELAAKDLYTKQMFEATWNGLRQKKKGSPEASEMLQEVMELFLTPLLSTSVFLPERYAPSLEEVIRIYKTVCKDSVAAGILIQNEDRPFKAAMSKEPLWRNPSYCFLDPLNSTTDANVFPPDYHQKLLQHIEELTQQADELKAPRDEGMSIIRRVGRPRKEGSTEDGET